MKKIFFAICLVACIATSFSQVTSSQLSKDENFISYVNNFNKIVNNISSTLNRNAYATGQTEINNIKTQRLSKSDELTAVARILKSPDINQLGIDLDNIAFNHKELRKKYGEIDNDIFLSSFSLVMKSSSNSMPQSVVAAGGGCRRPWRYALCSAAVGVEGGLMLTACEAASAGVATPACLAGVILWTANEIAECSDNYCGTTAN